MISPVLADSAHPYPQMHFRILLTFNTLVIKHHSHTTAHAHTKSSTTSTHCSCGTLGAGNEGLLVQGGDGAADY